MADETDREGNRRRLAYAALALWILLLDAWFQGPILGGRAPIGLAGPLFLVLVVVLVVRHRSRVVRKPVDRSFALAVAGMLVLATLVRWPALRAPGSLVSSDSAVAGIIAQELRSGYLPAPIYAPGFPYEGTLKPHITALLGLVLRSASTPLLYVLASHLFYLLWVYAIMRLAREVGGVRAALGAGLFMAVSPRFLTAFSLNNVGQYPEVNALGTLALVLLTPGTGLLLPGFILGLALWQQLLALYFILAAAVAALFTPSLRRPRLLVDGVSGFLAGAYPVFIWNAANAWATLEWVGKGGKRPVDRLTGLPEQLQRTFSVSFPKLFGLTDAGVPGGLATVLGLAFAGLVLGMGWARRREIREKRGQSVALLASLLFAIVVGTFAVSKFSHRGAQRPRYLLPVYTSCAVAIGWGIAALSRRSKAAGAAAALAMVGLNAVGLVPWLQARAHAQDRDQAFLDTLARLGVRTGYAGFWIGPKYTFLSDGQVILSGELGPDVSWVHQGQAALVRKTGPDALVVDPDLAPSLEARLRSLGCAFERTESIGQVVYHDLSRRVSLEDLAGFDVESPREPAAEADPTE
jgi:4-amino-4-deoxy-L-arabinose transferase-like glycosyltransferase